MRTEQKIGDFGSGEICCIGTGSAKKNGKQQTFVQFACALFMRFHFYFSTRCSF